MGEFELIRRYFDRHREHTDPGNPVVLGIGDDCALLAPRPGTQLAISTDMLVEGRHFFADVDPEALGHKALAVNLSDLAAMEPGRWLLPWPWRCLRRNRRGWKVLPRACLIWQIPTNASS